MDFADIQFNKNITDQAVIQTIELRKCLGGGGSDFWDFRGFVL